METEPVYEDKPEEGLSVRFSSRLGCFALSAALGIAYYGLDNDMRSWLLHFTGD